MVSEPLSSRQWTGSYVLAVLGVILWSAASLLADTYGTCTLDGFDQPSSECTDASCPSRSCVILASTCPFGPFGLMTITTASRSTGGLGYDHCADVDDQWTVCAHNDPGSIRLCSLVLSYYDTFCMYPVCFEYIGAIRECDSTLHCEPGE